MEPDLRVGVVKKVEDHPNADKLYILTVDIGEERRLVAGLKAFYSKEELIGKRIIVVKNLKKKKIRGVVSEGMLLAADDGSNVALLTTLHKVETGTKVKW